MKILNDNEKINLEKLRQMAERMFGDLVKAVVDVKQEKIALDAEMHSDLEKMFLENVVVDGKEVPRFSSMV